jgi:hypothetical protein
MQMLLRYPMNFLDHPYRTGLRQLSNNLALASWKLILLMDATSWADRWLSPNWSLPNRNGSCSFLDNDAVPPSSLYRAFTYEQVQKVESSFGKSR